jgi:hypothetical protein
VTIGADAIDGIAQAVNTNSMISRLARLAEIML